MSTLPDCPDLTFRFATRAEMRAHGYQFGAGVGRILAEETLATPGVAPPELVAARTAAVRQALADIEERLSLAGCRRRALMAFRDAAPIGVVAALDSAMVTVSAVGAAN